jgi:glycine/D-amino acid oxidase-like deaminating enzyme
MKTQAQIVVIGGGIFGAQVAYHLAKYGAQRRGLVEKGEIASGESSHAAGLVTQFATSQAMLEVPHVQRGVIQRVGAVRPRRQFARGFQQGAAQGLERSVSRAKALGLECEVIGPDEALKIMPQITKRSLRRDLPPARWAARSVHHHDQMVNFAKDMGVDRVHQHARDRDQTVRPRARSGGGDRQR